MPGRGRFWKIGGLNDEHVKEADLTQALQNKVNSGGGGHAIQDEGSPLTQRANLNFVGSGVVASDGVEDTTTVTIAGGGGIDHFAQTELLDDFFYSDPGNNLDLVDTKYARVEGAGSSLTLDQPQSGKVQGGTIFVEVNSTLSGQGSEFLNTELFQGGGHFNSNKNITMRIRMALTNDITTRVDAMGLVDDPFTKSGVTGVADLDSSVDEGFYFKKESGGNWIAVSQDSNSATETDTGVSSTVDVFQDFEVIHTPGVQDVFKIDGTTVVTHTTTIADSGVNLVLDHVIIGLGAGIDRSIEIDLWHVVADR